MSAPAPQTVAREEIVALPDEAATEELAARLASELEAPATVLLRGDLGVGKTTFTRYFLRARGVTGAVKSPTYTLLEPYELADGPLYHFDLYRINDPWELELAGFAELFDERALRFVEWPERGADWLPPADLEMAFTAHPQPANDETPGTDHAAGIEQRSVAVRWLVRD